MVLSHGCVFSSGDISGWYIQLVDSAELLALMEARGDAEHHTEHRAAPAAKDDLAQG